MSTQQAVVSDGKGQYKVAEDVQIPTLKPGTILCKVHAVALNPVDAKMIDYSDSPGAIGGSDFAGEVVSVSEDVTRFKPGDRVFAMMFGLNPIDSAAGAFAQYTLAVADLACKIPEWMSYEQGSTMGIGVATAGMALFKNLQLPFLGETDAPSNTYVLINGGATATGTIATQLVKRASLIPIVTCSPSNFSLVKSLGAAEAFDYNSPACAAEIKTYTSNTLAHVLDCVTSSTTMKMCYDAIRSSGGTYIALDPISTTVQYTRRDIKADWIMIYSVFGAPVKLAGVFGRAASKEDRAFAAKLFPAIEKLLEEKLLVNHPIEVRAGKLGDVARGIEDVRMNRVKAKKLVYSLA